jgi:energy-coupling factor transporter transmembrane protein EcfT
MRESLARVARGVRCRHPWLLLLLVVAAIVASMLVPSSSLVALLGVFPLCTLLTGNRARLARRALTIAPVAASAFAVRVACTHGATPVPWLGSSISREALLAGMAIVLRIGVAASWSTWLVASLAAAEIDRALLQLGAPAPLVELVALTRRFAAQLGATLRAAWSAAALRGGFLSAPAVARTSGLLAGVVVVRSLDRSDRIGIARALRGEARP